MALGVAIRESFSFWTGHPFDFEIWVRLGYYVSMGRDPYSNLQPIAGLSMPGIGVLPSIGYPPLWAFVQAAVYRLYSLLGVDNRFLYYFLIKQEMIIGDIIAAFLIFKIIQMRASREDATSAFAFWMLCPMTIILSSIWGMFDQLALDLILLSFLTLPATARSSAAEAVGIVLKALPVIFLPGLAMAQGSARRRVAFFSLAILLAAALALAPYLFFGSWTLSSLFSTGLSTVAKVYNSINAWVVVYAWSNYGALPPMLHAAVTWLAYAWIAFVLAGYVLCFAGVRGAQITTRYLMMTLLFVTLIFYVTRVNVNEQYITYFLGLGLIDRYWNGPGRKRLFDGIWLTTLAFLVFNNTYFTRFLTPISSYFVVLNTWLTLGLSGEVRMGAMTACGIVFTLLCVLYLRSLYADIRLLARQAKAAGSAGQPPPDPSSRAAAATRGSPGLRAELADRRFLPTLYGPGPQPSQKRD